MFKKIFRILSKKRELTFAKLFTYERAWVKFDFILYLAMVLKCLGAYRNCKNNVLKIVFLEIVRIMF